MQRLRSASRINLFCCRLQSIRLQGEEFELEDDEEEDGAAGDDDDGEGRPCARAQPPRHCGASATHENAADALDRQTAATPAANYSIKAAAATSHNLQPFPATLPHAEYVYSDGLDDNFGADAGGEEDPHAGHDHGDAAAAEEEDGARAWRGRAGGGTCPACSLLRRNLITVPNTHVPFLPPPAAEYEDPDEL